MSVAISETGREMDGTEDLKRDCKKHTRRILPSVKLYMYIT